MASSSVALLGHFYLSLTLNALFSGPVSSYSLVFTLTSLDSLRNNFLKTWVLHTVRFFNHGISKKIYFAFPFYDSLAR